MKKLLFTLAFAFLALPALAATYQVGPGKTYTNIGDVPWDSLDPGDTVEIYPKTPITAVTASESTAIAFTATLTANSAVLTGVSSVANLWQNQFVTCNLSGSGVTGDPIATAGVGTNTVTLVNAPYTSGSATCTARGTVVTLTASAASIPFGSTVWYAGAASTACGVYSGKYGSPTGQVPCAIDNTTQCGVQGSGLYGTETGGTACSGDTVSLLNPATIPSGTTLYFYPPYFEKLMLSSTGNSANELTVEGVPDPSTGVLPALEANYATTGPNQGHNGTDLYHDSYGLVIFLWNTAVTSFPAYVTIENLRFQDCSTTEYYYDGSNTLEQYYDGTADVRIEDLDHGLIKDNEIVNGDNGTFGATNLNADPSTLSDLDIYGNHYWWNGNTIGNYNHQSYLEGSMMTYEYNYYDQAQGAGNDQLKDRSSGTVVRYNYFVPAGRDVDLVDAQNSFARAVPMDTLVPPTSGFAAGATTLTFTPSTFTGDTVAGVAEIANVSSYAWLTAAYGAMGVAGSGLPSGAAVWGRSGSTLFLTQAATATATGVTFTGNTVAGINVGDRVGFVSAGSGWGYPGTALPTMPPVSAVDVDTDTVTVASGGIPAAIGQWTADYAYGANFDLFLYVAGTWYDFRAGASPGTSGATQPSWCTTQGCTVTDGTVTWTNYVAQVPALQVISQQLNPYKQTFVYGNIFNLNQSLTNVAYPSGPPIHYGWDTAGGIDSVSDRAGTLYFYDNTFVEQWDGSGDAQATGNQAIFQPESNADNIYAANNLFYVTNGPGSGNPATYFLLLGNSTYAYTGYAQVQYTGGNNQMAASPGVGSAACSGLTETGWAVCNTPQAPLSPTSPPWYLGTGATANVSSIATETQAAMYPGGIVDDLFKLQSGSSAIGAASSLPSAITSNTLDGNFTPVYQPDGTARSNLSDLGAWQYTSATIVSIAITPITVSIGSGNTEQYDAICHYSDGTTADCTTSVAWASSNTAVATIGATTGLATVVSAGSAGITATESGITSNTAALSVDLVPGSKYLGLGLSGVVLK